MPTTRRTGLVAAALLALAAAPANAGGGPGFADEEGIEVRGTHFFGEVKEVAGFRPVEGARVKIAVSGTLQFLVVLTDADGRFRLEGFGRNVAAAKIEVTCTKQGFRQVEAMRRQMHKDIKSPIEVECLMTPEKKREKS